ncbi:MAG: Acetyl-/propionyl-coenzyme A carboxylase alpha chain, partial [Alphaproteobacteria bacterium MarineAlpha2_Bin1]
MFSKILIANRGEIACRIINTARKMGIHAISVFSEADRFSKHVSLSDESIYIGNSESKESYLNIDSIIKAAKMTKAEAIHPGYGFLSENPDFVDAVNKAGICFIGPSKEAISIMGDKIESKILADKANVSTVPGFIGEVVDLNHAQQIANSIGYPVMIKASAGGGGKGMRIAKNPE